MNGKLNLPDLSRHENLSVRIWNEYLDGHPLSMTATYEGISVARAKKILGSEPPDIIIEDLRYKTGRRAAWISQSGKDDIKTNTGANAAFIVIFLPHRITNGNWEKGLRSIRKHIRQNGNPRFDFGEVCESVEFDVLLRMVHVKGYPAFNIDEEGNGKPYDNEYSQYMNVNPGPDTQMVPLR